MGKKSREKRERREGKTTDEKKGKFSEKQKNVRKKLIKDFTKDIKSSAKQKKEK